MIDVENSSRSSPLFQYRPFLDRIIVGKQTCAKRRLDELREPDGMAAAVGVLDDMRRHAKPVLIEQRAIFVRIEAGVIQRLAAKAPDRLAMRGAAREHQCGARRSMLPK